MNTNLFTTTLLRWYERHGRIHPWRATRDPYAIWLSEIILQQTRVEQGQPYWERFMQRFPTVDSLAAASQDEVLRLWQGLGYYSRARNLHVAARQIVALGGFPNTFEQLRELKGVGDYTAAAIASFAFNQCIAAVDGNAYRVLARYFCIDTPINTAQGKRLFTELAQSLIPEHSAADFNQAMMDFGATWCTPQMPKCAECPLQETCGARREGRVSKLPVKHKKAIVKERRMTYVYVRCNGETAFRRRPPGDIWAGLWEPLLVDEAGIVPETMAKALRLVKKGVRHMLTHRLIIADFYLLEVQEKPSLPPDYVWINESEIDNYGIPRLIELFLSELNN